MTTPDFAIAASHQPPQRAPRTRSRTRAERQKPFWERAYKGHGYWLGQTRLGHVEVSPGQLLEMKYQWHAGTHAGQATSLRDAKRLVEQTVLLGGRQLTLFSDDYIASPTIASLTVASPSVASPSVASATTR